MNQLTNIYYVLDGGLLLHTVIWTKKTTFRQIFDQYVDYVGRHYPLSDCMIVFDGYPDNGEECTKGAERQRREQKHQCTQIDFVDNENMGAPASQKVFFPIKQIKTISSKS